MKTLLLSAAPLSLLLPQVALAQEPLLLDEIVVSATIEPQAINRTGATVDVVEADTIADAPLSVSGTLDRIPGVTVSASGGLGSSSILRVRGLDGKYLGVRIDGIDVTDPSSTQTQFDFGGLTGVGLGRIELVKGAQSALYGSESVGGLVDIRTFELEEDGSVVSLGLEAGSFGTINTSAGYAVRTGGNALSFNLSRVEADGFSSRSSDTEEDGFEQTFFTIKGETELANGITLGGSAFYRDTEVEIDRSATDPSGENTGLQRAARVFTAFDAFGIEHELSFSSFDIERRDPGGFTTEFNGDRTQLAYLGTTEVALGTLSFGIDETEERFSTPTESGSTETQSALVELLTTPSGSTDLALSLRYDDNEDFGGTLSARIALAWQAQPDLTIRAVAGNGFRAPSLFERFSAFGDPNLEVEESRSVEFGVEKRFSGGHIEATAFYTEIDNLIDFDGAATACGSGFGCYNQVPGTTVSQGIELAGEAALGEDLTVFGTYTYTDAKTDGTRLVRVPRHDLSIGVEKAFTDRLSAKATATHVADVEASPFAPANNKVGDYTVFDVGFTYDVTNTTEAYVRIENLFDEDYETAGGFNAPDRSFYAGIRARF